MERQSGPTRREVLIFELDRLRFTFCAIDEIRFGRHAGNTLRGALGVWLRATASDGIYESIFAPTASDGPSGYRNPPRPFVLRCSHLNGAQIPAGEVFSFDVHSFDLREPELLSSAMAHALARLETEGIGQGRTRARLLPQNQISERVTISLATHTQPMERIAVDFRTPTELKGYEHGDLSFGVLFCRVRDRICTLSERYGFGALQVDHEGLGEAADRVFPRATQLEWAGQNRRSSRTGDVHPIGGFTGRAIFAGNGLEHFAGWLTAAKYTGVGRRTVWGNGEIDWQSDLAQGPLDCATSRNDLDQRDRYSQNQQHMNKSAKGI